MKKMLFIINPRSGKEQIRSRLLEILDSFVKAGYGPSVYITQGPKDAEYQAARAKTKELVVCSGGDGTLNEVVSGLMTITPEKRPELGYIPSGSTNDFASSLGLPKNMRKAAQTAALGKPFLVDVGVFGKNRYFVYVAAFGAFTEVSYSTPQETKNILGHQAYMLEAIKRLTGLKSYRMRLTWEHLGEQRELEEEFILGMVTNTTSIGGFKGLVGMDVALDDGEFEVLLVRKPRTPLDIASIAAYLIQREGENECVFKFRTSKLTVQSE
ncbi:MAG: diacylglycerol/lipid kinase family protein, partial [Clostridium fessum]